MVYLLNKWYDELNTLLIFHNINKVCVKNKIQREIYYGPSPAQQMRGMQF